MSSKAQVDVPEVEKVTIALSEKGLTDLAAMLVKSGRMSGPSFREWANRTQLVVGRWANEQKTTAASKTKKGGSKATNPTVSKKQRERELKDKEKLSALKKVVPSCTLGNWKEVTNLSQPKAIVLQDLITAKYAELSADGNVKDGLIALGLTEAELKQTRAFMPYIPSFSKPDSRAILKGASSSKKPNDSVDGKGTGSDNTTNPMTDNNVNPTDAILVDSKTTDHTNTVKVSGLPPGSAVQIPKGKTKQELIEHFEKYNWTSSSAMVTAQFHKNVKDAYQVVGVSNNNWKQRNAASKFDALARYYKQK